jgi:hypothetical protein
MERAVLSVKVMGLNACEPHRSPDEPIGPTIVLPETFLIVSG